MNYNRFYVDRLKQVTLEELEYAQHAIGEFGSDNRAGIPGTLHRISAIRSRKGQVIGLTYRVGRAVRGQIEMIKDLLDYGESILFVGRLIYSPSPSLVHSSLLYVWSQITFPLFHKGVAWSFMGLAFINVYVVVESGLLRFSAFKFSLPLLSSF